MKTSEESEGRRDLATRPTRWRRTLKAFKRVPASVRSDDQPNRLATPKREDIDRSTGEDPPLGPLAVVEWMGSLQDGVRAYAAACLRARLLDLDLPQPPTHLHCDCSEQVRRKVDALLAEGSGRPASRVASCESIMVQMADDVALTGSDDDERTRLEHLFIRSGYARPLARLYGAVVRPFDAGTQVPASVEDAHRAARALLRETLKSRDGQNPWGGTVELTLLSVAADLLAATRAHDVAATVLRLEAALAGLTCQRPTFEESLVDIAVLPSLPEQPITDEAGRPIGLWR